MVCFLTNDPTNVLWKLEIKEERRSVIRNKELTSRPSRGHVARLPSNVLRIDISGLLVEALLSESVKLLERAERLLR